MAKPTKTAPKRTNKSKTKKGKLDFLTNRINFKSRKALVGEPRALRPQKSIAIALSMVLLNVIIKS